MASANAMISVALSHVVSTVMYDITNADVFARNSTNSVDSVTSVTSSSVGGTEKQTEANAVLVSKDIVFFSLAVIIPCGLLFNILSFAIYMRRQMRKRATSLYFAALAASDTLSLIAIAFDYWLKNSRLNMAFVRWSPVVCVSVTYVSYASRLFSAILVTSFTIERCFGVAFPLRRGILSTRAHACRVIAAESIGCFLLTSYTLFTIGIVDAGNGIGIECDVLPKRYSLYFVLNTLVLICGSIIVPIIVICTLNVYLVYRIFKRRKFVQKNIRFSDTAAAAAGSAAGVLLMHGGSDDNKPLCAPLMAAPPPPPQDIAAFRRTTSTKSSKAMTALTPPVSSLMSTSMSNATAKHDEVAGLLLLVSTVFVLTNVPYCVAFLLLFFSAAGIGSVTLPLSTMFVAKYTTSVFYYLNYSVNFLLYYVWARRFRHELCHMLCCGRRNRCLSGKGGKGAARGRNEKGGALVGAGGNKPSPPLVTGYVVPTKRIYRVPAAGVDGEILVINKFGGVP